MHLIHRVLMLMTWYHFLVVFHLKTVLKHGGYLMKQRTLTFSSIIPMDKEVCGKGRICSASNSISLGNDIVVS